MIGPLLDGPAQLRTREHRNIQLARKCLERAGYFTECDRAVVVPAHVHQLQVVHDQQVQVALLLQTARLAAQFHGRLERGLVHVDLQVGQQTDGIQHAHLLVLPDEVHPQPVAVDVCLGS